MSVSPDQRDLLNWIEALGLGSPSPLSWQRALASAPEALDRVEQVLGASPIAAEAVESISQFCSPELIASARSCQAWVRRLNAIIESTGIGSTEWRAAYAEYVPVVAQLQVAGQRHHQQVVAALASCRSGGTMRPMAAQGLPRHPACSDGVRDQILRLREVLVRRQGSAQPAQPKRMADALGLKRLHHSYYITSVDNVASICKVGVLPHSLAPRDRTDISKAGIQRNRSGVGVTGHDGVRRQLHDFVPMFFAPKTPMLWERSDSRSGVGKENLCLLEFEIRRIAGWCEELVVTNRNAATLGVTFASDPAQATIVPHDIIIRSTWSDVPDGAPRRSAELLCYPLVPAPSIRAVHVCSELAKTRTRDLLRASGCSTPVEATPSYFPSS